MTVSSVVPSSCRSPFIKPVGKKQRKWGAGEQFISIKHTCCLKDLSDLDQNISKSRHLLKLNDFSGERQPAEGALLQQCDNTQADRPSQPASPPDTAGKGHTFALALVRHCPGNTGHSMIRAGFFVLCISQKKGLIVPSARTHQFWKVKGVKQ